MTAQLASRDDFEALATAVRRLAEAQLTAGDKVMPAMLLLGSVDATEVMLPEVPVPFPAQELGRLNDAALVCVPLMFLMRESRQPQGKQIITRLLSAFAKRPDVRVLAFMHEVWVTTQPAGRPIPARSPAEDPDRTEAVLITLMSGDCQAMMVCPLKTDPAGRRVLFEGPLTFDTLSQSYTRFMRPTRKTLH